MEDELYVSLKDSENNNYKVLENGIELNSTSKFENEFNNCLFRASDNFAVLQKCKDFKSFVNYQSSKNYIRSLSKVIGFSRAQGNWLGFAKFKHIEGMDYATMFTIAAFNNSQQKPGILLLKNLALNSSDDKNAKFPYSLIFVPNPKLTKLCENKVNSFECFMEINDSDITKLYKVIAVDAPKMINDLNLNDFIEIGFLERTGEFRECPFGDKNLRFNHEFVRKDFFKKNNDYFGDRKISFEKVNDINVRREFGPIPAYEKYKSLICNSEDSEKCLSFENDF